MSSDKLAEISTISYFFFFLEFGVQNAFNQPFHAAEGGLGAPDEVAVSGDHQLTLLSVVTRNVGGFPVASGRNRPVTCLLTYSMSRFQSGAD